MPVLLDIGRLVTPVPGERQGVLRDIPDAALAWRNDRVTWVGERQHLPSEYRDERRYSAGGALVLPGLVDCHTHLAFGGWRTEEFEQRILGRTYLDIAREGGGIQRTVALTRAASDDELRGRCHEHLRGMAALGVTTVECKSGYGLTLDDELRLLRTYDHLGRDQPLRIVPTLLGAHTVPAAYVDCREAFVTLVRDRMAPEASRARLAVFCDVFVEEGAFTVAEARDILKAAQECGLKGKLHADQLNDGGGAVLAAEIGAVSADHLEHVSPRGIDAMAAGGVIAVGLPFATLYLKQPPMPARALRNAGVPVAVATDFNPGTAPSYHLPLAMMLACTMLRLTPAEVVAGATAVAAAALGLEGEVGTLGPGHSADFIVIDSPDEEHWLYHFRANACTQTWVRGVRYA